MLFGAALSAIGSGLLGTMDTSTGTGKWVRSDVLILFFRPGTHGWDLDCVAAFGWTWDRECLHVSLPKFMSLGDRTLRLMIVYRQGYVATQASLPVEDRARGASISVFTQLWGAT